MSKNSKFSCRVLQHFNTTPEEYSVIFTSGCTAALKLVAESFPWRPQTESKAGSHFCYLTDSHTSVVGIRGLTSGQDVVTLPVSSQEVENRTKDEAQGEDVTCQTPHLFCYPAQSNFSGRKYPLSYVKGIQARRLYPACDHCGRWFVLLDAASYVSCSPLNLQDCPADFIPISFYKVFGFPTGLGALLVRKDAASILKKTYFGGGTAAAYLSGEDYYVHVANISDRWSPEQACKTWGILWKRTVDPVSNAMFSVPVMKVWRWDCVFLGHHCFKSRFQCFIQNHR